jgi:hypothetical protein
MPEERLGLWRASRADGKDRGPQTVAVRLLRDPAEKENRARLAREYGRLRELQGLPVPQALGHYEGHGALAMTWVEGTRVSDLLRAREASAISLDDATVAELGISLLRVLKVAHGRPTSLVHGRLRPEILCLDAAGRLHVLGWGGWGTNLWGIGTAPEVRERSSAGPPVDLFSAGVLLMAMMEPRSLRLSGMMTTVELIGRRWPGMGRLLEDLTAFSPLERPPSAEVALSRLLTQARQQGGVARLASVTADTRNWLREGAVGVSVDAPNPSDLAGREDHAGGGTMAAEALERALPEGSVWLPIPEERRPLRPSYLASRVASLSAMDVPEPFIALSRQTPNDDAPGSGLRVGTLQNPEQVSGSAPSDERSPDNVASGIEDPKLCRSPRVEVEEQEEQEEQEQTEQEATETAQEEPVLGGGLLDPRFAAIPDSPSDDEAEGGAGHGTLRLPKLAVPEWIAASLVTLLLIGLAWTLLRGC